MKKHFVYIFNFLFLLSLTTQAIGDWELIKSNNGIQIFSKSDNNSKYIEIKGISEVKSPLKAFVALMKDVDNFKHWMHAIKETSLINRNSDYHFTYYLHSDIPWPGKDRDVILNFRILRDPKSHVIYTKSYNISGKVPKKEDIHRIPYVNASWRFVPLENNRVKIIYKTKIKPGIQLPNWLADKIYNLGPYNTIKNMKQIIHKEKYQSANIDLNKI